MIRTEILNLLFNLDALKSQGNLILLSQNVFSASFKFLQSFKDLVFSLGFKSGLKFTSSMMKLVKKPHKSNSGLIQIYPSLGIEPLTPQMGKNGTIKGEDLSR